MPFERMRCCSVNNCVTSRKRQRVAVVSAPNHARNGHVRAEAAVNHHRVPLPDARVREVQMAELIVRVHVHARVVKHCALNGRKPFKWLETQASVIRSAWRRIARTAKSVCVLLGHLRFGQLATWTSICKDLEKYLQGHAP
eukprot:6183284-Pleurochrysis_carterae.AAC.2